MNKMNKVSKVSKKYKIRNLKKTNLYKNKNKNKNKKTKLNKFYNLSGGNIKTAQNLFVDNYDSIKPYLITEAEILAIKPEGINNNLTITNKKTNKSGKEHIDPTKIKIWFENIIKKLTAITTDFFAKNDTDVKDYDTYIGEQLTNFCKIFINSHIEWIINCYINNNFKSKSDTKDNLLFQNYNLFLQLYNKLAFLIKNSELLLEHINRHPRYWLYDVDYHKIRDNFRPFYKDYYILGKKYSTNNEKHKEDNTPYFTNLFELNSFVNKFEPIIVHIKEFLKNTELKKTGKGADNIDIALETDNLFVYKIKTKAGSLYYGSKTKWCTATKTSENMYLLYYAGKGALLYIIQAKDKEYDGKDKYQLQKSIDKYQLNLKHGELVNDQDIPVSFTYLFAKFPEDKTELENFLRKNCTYFTAPDKIYKYTEDNTTLTINLLHNCDIFFNSNVSIVHKTITSLDLNIIDIPLDNLLNGLDNLTSLTIGGKFNQPLGNSLDNLTQLTTLFFQDNFNQPFGDSLKKLTNLEYLSISGRFNQLFGDSLNNLISLKELIIAGRANTIQDFNQPLNDSLDKLKNLKSLTIYNSIYSQLLNHSLDKLTNLNYLLVLNIDANGKDFLEQLKKRGVTIPSG